MTDLLRDRRTLIAMIILPLVLIPVILTIAARFSTPESSSEIENIRVAIMTNDNGQDLIKRLERRKDVELMMGISPYEFKNLIREDSIDFGLIIDKDFDSQIKKGESGELELFYQSSMPRDTMSYERLAKTIRDYRDDIVDERLSALGTNRSVLRPTRTKTTNVKVKKSTIGSIAGGILPLFFVIFCFMGSMYPAIDLFTGEKERGTIETLMVLPVNRFQILIGKLLVIATAGIISGLLNFLGIYLFMKLNPDLPFISAILNLKSAFWIIMMLIPLSTFFAGLLIPISIYAKSFKEAQSLIQPLLIVILVPVALGILPGFELNWKTALIPIMNISLASKSIVSGNYDWILISLVFISMFVFTGFGVLISKQWFSNEQNLFRS